MTRHFPDDGNPKLLYECICGDCGLIIDGVNWHDWKEIWICFWYWGRDGKCTCWKCRLRHVWRILKEGHPYTDMVTLTPGDAKKMAQEILKAAEILSEQKGD